MSMKLGGIVSGLDTNSLITQLMQIEKQPIQLLMARQQKYELRKSVWQEVNSTLLALKSANDKMNNPSSYNKRTATTSKDTVVTATASDGASVGTYNINITKLAQNHQVKGDTLAAGWTSGIGSFTISDGTTNATINVTGAWSLETIKNEINKATDGSTALKVSATVVNNTLVLSHDETGAGKVMSFTDAGGILQSMGVTTDAAGTIKNTIQTSQDAEFEVNSIAVIRSSNDKLTDVISGVTLNLVSESSATVTVGKDVDTAYNIVKEFVDKYNDTIDFINEKLNEKTVKEPVSDVDRKKGLLRGDRVLFQLKNALSADLSGSVDGVPDELSRFSVPQLDPKFGSISDTGIGVTTTTYKENDVYVTHLQIDETKLKKALTDNPDAVIQLITGNTDLNADGKVGDGEKGVAVRISEKVKELTDSLINNGVIAVKMDGFNKTIDDYKARIVDYEERLKLREKNLWAQFTALETSLSRLNNQASWLAGQLGALQ